MEFGPLNAHRHNLQKELVCIEYPGLVRNPERMMASFGGNLELSTVRSYKFCKYVLGIKFVNTFYRQ